MKKFDVSMLEWRTLFDRFKNIPVGEIIVFLDYEYGGMLDRCFSRRKSYMLYGVDIRIFFRKGITLWRFRKTEEIITFLFTCLCYLTFFDTILYKFKIRFNFMRYFGKNKDSINGVDPTARVFPAFNSILLRSFVKKCIIWGQYHIIINYLSVFISLKNLVL